MGMEKILGRKPDGINEIGVKWWLDKILTNHGRNKDRNGVSIDLSVFYVEEKNGYRDIVIVVNDEIVYANQKAESIWVRIDIMKMHESLKRDINKEEMK